MALQSRMRLALPRGVRSGCRVCPMDTPRTPASARAKQQAPGGAPGTWIRPPDRGYFARPWFDFKEKYTTRTTVVRRVQARQHTRQPATEHIKTSTGARWNSMSRVCPRPPGTGVFKTRLFGGLRGRKRRETSVLDIFIFRRKKTTPGGRGPGPNYVSRDNPTWPAE